MHFESLGHTVDSGPTVTFGKIYPNNLPISKQRRCSPTPEPPSEGSLLVNVAKTGRNICKASKEDPKTCGEGKKIKKKELRVGLGGCKHGGRDWRHWRCLTLGFIANMKVAYPTPDSLPGFTDLSSTQQKRVRNTYNPPNLSRRKDAQLEATRRSTRLA